MEPSANIEKFSERSKVSQSPTKLVLRCVARESPRWLCVRVWWDLGAHCTWGSVVIFHKLLPSSSSFHQSFNSYVRNCLHTFAIVCHFLQRSLFSPVTPSITFAFMVHLMDRIQQLPYSVLRRQPLPSQLRQPLEILRCKPLPSLPRRCPQGHVEARYAVTKLSFFSIICVLFFLSFFFSFFFSLSLSYHSTVCCNHYCNILSYCNHDYQPNSSDCPLLWLLLLYIIVIIIVDTSSKA